MSYLVYLNRRPAPSFRRERLRRFAVSIAMVALLGLTAWGYVLFMISLLA